MKGIDELDFTLKLFGIVDNAHDEGFGEGKIKADSLALLRGCRSQDNYDSLMHTTAHWLALREIALTERERIEMHRDNPQYWI